MKSSSGPPVPVLMQMASHPLRWALMTELAASDLRVRELVQAVGEPQNLVSYHLGLLRSAELVTSRRSSFDGRVTYYHLDLGRCAAALGDAAAALHPSLAPAMTDSSPGSSVLFLCTGNGARSPMAEALLRRQRGSQVKVASAGSHPKPAVHPNARRVLQAEYGIDLGPRRPQAMDAVSGPFDYVITLCDKIREIPHHQGTAVTMHWSLPDPSVSGSDDEETYPEFQRVAREIDARIGYLSL